ncbi:TonB-dependent receptor plug domain-containing protein [Formosa sp. S-31]|uniref:TonB-dependent receptor plug domain-containing protein n=1 Tax=Formosa sp. S-31 TaxID=2790949 RepID=UPI003EBFF834
MKNILIFCFWLLTSLHLSAQISETIKTQNDTTVLNEIIIRGEGRLNHYKQEKSMATIDDYLEKSDRATMIKRGNYAWEPTLNNMTSERLAVTIDGMQIFGACTDKMDPVTSYVDVSNINKITVNSGQAGTEDGHSIGGGINLQLPKPKFYKKELKSSLDTGYETNGNYFSSGLDLSYSDNRFFINADAIYRHSDNYKAGNNKEIMYSQFEKYNISLQAAYKINTNNTLDTKIIYDQANNIGYPALPMDVSLAKAIIGSASHIYTNKETLINNWETKLYFNTITHIMDDSQRPDVSIRMDMPGWSDTYGFYSKAKLNFKDNHHSLINLNGYYNRSLAEMTMYPNNPSEADMFMYTWPDIRTLYSGIFFKDHWTMSETQSLTSSVRLGFHNNRIANLTGLESLSIFYPTLQDSKSRFLTSINTKYQANTDKSSYSFSLGYGERAPSVSEGYGFFLFNSFDNYDYIGNPNLKNEKSIELNASYKRSFNRLNLNIESSWFYILDYIIGETNTELSAMTIGANGVRIYSALDYATIFNTYATAEYKFNNQFSFNAGLGYNYGIGSNDENLPLIKPFSYHGEFIYNTNKFNAALQITGNGNQNRYSSYYGETKTADYAILNLNFGHNIPLKQNRIILKYGIENLLDTYYSTYANWNNIAQQGRNFYTNISYSFK